MSIELQEYIDGAADRDRIYRENEIEIDKRIEQIRAEFDELLDNGAGKITPILKGIHDLD
ncbi:MAG: hypothetical protein PHH98_01365 [Candidatus Gracilibacteria bacterium]|nr:hypothetical protein [Candidatus Gracilibacteria bacterium]